MPQNNYKEVIEAFADSVKNISIEKFLKNIDEIEQCYTTFENDLGFSPSKQLKDKIISDEHKSN